MPPTLESSKFVVVMKWWFDISLTFVSSDRDHRANPATGTHSATTGVNDPEGTHGPHSSRVANTLDPRVDSDRDNRALGGNSHTTGTTHSAIPGAGHSSTGHTTGLTGSSNVTGYNDPTGTHGPHSSRAANAADPRVDSDRDHRGAPGTHTGTAHTGTAHTGAAHTGSSNVTGYNDPTGTHGPHSSRAANAADPRIDSDRDGRAAPGAAGTSHLGSGPGPAPNTAGPHSKDILNKVDPRVDSDLDGSKTIGGNKTLS